MKMEEKIRKKLEAAFAPDNLVVSNQSHLHAGHAGDDGSGESHFRIAINSSELNALSRVQAERAVTKALAEEMKTIHALSIKFHKG